MDRIFRMILGRDGQGCGMLLRIFFSICFIELTMYYKGRDAEILIVDQSDMGL